MHVLVGKSLALNLERTENIIANFSFTVNTDHD